MKKLPKDAIVFMFMITNSSKINIDNDIYAISFLGQTIIRGGAE